MKIIAADWVLPISSEPIERGAVAIKADEIIAVGRTDELKKQFTEAQFEDLGESAILPGFINCHSHLELSIMRGFLDDVEDQFFKWLLKIAVTRDKILTVEDIEVSAVLGALEGAKAGVTCFGDIGRNGRAGFDALKKIGLRGVVFQETEFSPYNENAQEEFTKLNDKFLALRSDENGLVEAGISPHAPYTVSQKLFETISDYALAENVKISIHAAESHIEEELMLLNSGAMADFYRERGINWTPPKLSSIEYLLKIGVLEAKPLLAHCIRTSEKDWNFIKESGSSIAHCPKSNAKFGHRSAPFERFLDNNLRVGLGSDSVASNNTCDILEEGRFATLIARSREDKNRLIKPKEIIETMTLGGAKALHLENKIGALERGKQADLVALSLENIGQRPIHDIYSAIVFASSARDVVLTMVAGKKIYHSSKCQTVDEEAVLEKVREIALKMQAT
jgi:5-methylthioadenosine/S-adenosylhomocysteine deaminase